MYNIQSEFEFDMIQQHYIEIANELRYKKKVIDAIRMASSENEITRIMAEARREMIMVDEESANSSKEKPYFEFKKIVEEIT